MHYRQGFTLIEAIVVVAIIGLLTAGAAVSLREYRFRAEVRATIAELEQLETAFRAHRQFELLNDGWPDQVGPPSLYVNTIVNNGSGKFPNFKDYFIGDLDVFNQGLLVSYVFDRSDPYRCSGAGYENSGVNIVLNSENVSQQYYDELFDRINTAVDGDDPVNGCGKIRIGTVGGRSELYYNIASSTFGY